MGARSGVQRGFSRLSDRVGGSKAAMLWGQIFTVSGTFTASISGLHYFAVIGGGANGGVAARTNTSVTAAGGGSGSLAYAVEYLAAGQTVAVTVATSPASQSASAPSAQAGNNGLPSIVVLPTRTVTAGGGFGGQAQSGSNLMLGGAGGVATGGDENFNGTAGGNADQGTALSQAGATGANNGGPGGSASSSPTTVATGGGAGGPRYEGGKGAKGGDAVAGISDLKNGSAPGAGAAGSVATNGGSATVALGAPGRVWVSWEEPA